MGSLFLNNFKNLSSFFEKKAAMFVHRISMQNKFDQKSSTETLSDEVSEDVIFASKQMERQ